MEILVKEIKMTPNLFLIIGVPGSGKSTFIRDYVTYYKENNTKVAAISRDDIRFSLLKEGEEYFSHEKEVYKILWESINSALSEGKSVFVDQTSLTKASRRWLLDHVTGYDKVFAIWIDEKLDTCLERNEFRKGTKRYVPRGIIRRMFVQFEMPSIDEGFDAIYHYSSDNCLLERMDIYE